MIYVPDGAYLTDETNLVQVLGRDGRGDLVCEDVSGPVESQPEAVLVEAGKVRPASAPRISGRWRLVRAPEAGAAAA